MRLTGRERCEVSVLFVKEGELSISVKEWDSMLTVELTGAFLEESLVPMRVEQETMGGKGVGSLEKEEVGSR